MTKKIGYHGWFAFMSLLAVSASSSLTMAAPLVPGTGVRQDKASDNFEDPNWRYYPNLPKSSREQDERERRPWGYSANRRWIEGPHRGTPDLLRRVETPENGLPGSEGSLLIRTRRSCYPNRLTYQTQQDDLLVNVSRAMRGMIPVSRQPSCVVRVYLPPFEEWENRTGTSFALRMGLRGSGRKPEMEPYWPGLFIYFQSETSRRYKRDSAHLIVRARESGRDYRGPEITQLGWWTLGMSVTSNGKIHYYAKPGLEDLTQADHIASHYSYGNRARYLKTYFFCVLNRDDGQTWSTPWIIDDPALYVVPRGTRRVAERP